MNKFEILYLNQIPIKIYLKKIRNINLKVSINGEVKLSAPKNTSQKIINDFINSKEDWIKNALQKFEKSIKLSKVSIENDGIIYLFGAPKKVRIIHSEIIFPEFIVLEDYLQISINEKLSLKTRERHFNTFLEKSLRSISKPMFDKWEQKLEVSKKDLIIKNLKGKWGYCDTRTKDICLNIELSKRNLEFIEYVVLHEICHLLVPNHGPKFKKLLDTHMPTWRQIKAEID